MQTPKKMTHEELVQHLEQLEVADRDDRDEMLTDLLCHVYRSKDSQDS